MDEEDDVPVVTAPDPHSALIQWLDDRLDDEDKTTANQMIGDLLDWATDSTGWAGDSQMRHVVAGRTTMNTKAVVRRIQAIDQARAKVRPYVGDITMTVDSADQV
jgi:hypothetical protein